MPETNDDKDLEKVLNAIASPGSDTSANGGFEETPIAGAVASPFPDTAGPAKDDESETPVISHVTSGTSFASEPDPVSSPAPVSDPEPEQPSENPLLSSDAPDDGPLAAIKKDAIVELRPLVDKLTLSPEEKFDTYLLLIRSTDDTELIGPAHEAAKAIADETRRAEALLDIIKEIDFLSQHKAA